MAVYLGEEKVGDIKEIGIDNVKFVFGSNLNYTSFSAKTMTFLPILITKIDNLDTSNVTYIIHILYNIYYSYLLIIIELALATALST